MCIRDRYRGAGRPEAVYLLERLVDKAADQLHINRIELRRRNIIDPDCFPYKSPLGLIYDSGLFEKNLNLGLSEMDWIILTAVETKLRNEERGWELDWPIMWKDADMECLKT